MKPFVHIIILNWKRPKDTIDCLVSLEHISYPNYGVILVDNNSNDGSIGIIGDWLAQSTFSFKEHSIAPNSENIIDVDNSVSVNLLKNYENSGFAKGNNIGIRIAKHLKSPYVLLLNNDTEVEEDFLDILVEHKKKFPEYSILTPQIRLFDPKTIIWNCGGKLVLCGFWKRYYYSRLHIGQLNETKPMKRITFVTGCALFYDPNEMGLLTEDFFFGEEDFEFSLRAKKNNKKIGCVLDSIIYHKVGTSLNTVNSVEKRYIHLLNRLVNTRKNNFNFLWPFFAIGSILYNAIELVRVERLGLRKTVKYSWALLSDALTLSGVNQKKFVDVVLHKKW